MDNLKISVNGEILELDPFFIVTRKYKYKGLELRMAEEIGNKIDSIIDLGMVSGNDSIIKVTDKGAIRLIESLATIYTAMKYNECQLCDK